MEAANASRQARLAALRTTKASQEQQAGESSSSNAKANANANAAACSSSSSSSTIHPFRRAFLLNSSLRTSSSARLGGLRAPRESADASASAGADADAESAPLTAESSARRVAESSEEMALLRTFRNWDPMTGQPRRAIWTTATPNAAAGIEEEVKGVQAAVLAEDAQRRKQDLDLFNIAPKRANWDLKRHLDKRLKKLERRDREARLILIRECHGVGGDEQQCSARHGTWRADC